ncbi:MAG: M28 family peptidase, partial [Gemmatimonadota bacterium]|nr:M28 family peptidase [Gemmatimonadota bacterium]
GAAALVTIPTFADLSTLASPNAGRVAFGPNGPNYQVVKFQTADDPGVPQITAGLELVNALFQGEKETAEQVFAAASANTPLPSFALAAGKTLSATVSVTTVHNHGEDVIGMLEGSDPVLKNEYVVISAHLDHIGMSPMLPGCHALNPVAAAGDSTASGLTADGPQCDTIDNGADDDGSGTVTALEIAQKIASLDPHPKRSILFVWHTGEEKGLLGSTYYTDHPSVPRDSIVAQLNMDMVGRGDAWDMTGTRKNGSFMHGGANTLYLVGSRRLSTELGNLVEQVNADDHHGFDFDYSFDADGHPENVYCRSDHYEYARYGIPITFFTTGLHSDYHQVTDEPEYIDYDHMARVGNLVEDVAVHVANLDHRVVVDHPKPDPHGVCKQ